MTLDSTTLRELARIMLATLEGEVPASPQQHGAFNATLTWAQWCEQQAALADAELPEDTTCRYCAEIDPSDPACYKSRNDYVCTRKPGHDGPHVACGDDHQIETWETR